MQHTMIYDKSQMSIFCRSKHTAVAYILHCFLVSFLICLFLFFGRRSHITAHYENAREAYWRNIFHMIIVILTNVVVLLIINFILVIFQ